MSTRRIAVGIGIGCLVAVAAWAGSAGKADFEPGEPTGAQVIAYGRYLYSGYLLPGPDPAWLILEDVEVWLPGNRRPFATHERLRVRHSAIEAIAVDRIP